LLKCFPIDYGISLDYRNYIVRKIDEKNDKTGSADLRYSASVVNFIWFTDEKIFIVTALNDSQNDRVLDSVDHHMHTVINRGVVLKKKWGNA